MKRKESKKRGGISTERKGANDKYWRALRAAQKGGQRHASRLMCETWTIWRSRTAERFECFRNTPFLHFHNYVQNIRSIELYKITQNLTICNKCCCKWHTHARQLHLLEKLAVVHLLNMFSAFQKTRGFITLTPSQINPVWTISHLIYLRSILALQSQHFTRLASVLFASSLSTKICTFLYNCHACYRTRPPHSTSVIILMII